MVDDAEWLGRSAGRGGRGRHARGTNRPGLGYGHEREVADRSGAGPRRIPGNQVDNGLAEIELIVQRSAVNVRQEICGPRPAAAAVAVGAGREVGRSMLMPDRKDVERIVVVVQGEAELVQVVLALRPAGGLARLLNRRQQQRDQDGDDRNHHQQLDQRKARVTPSRREHVCTSSVKNMKFRTPGLSAEAHCKDRQSPLPQKRRFNIRLPCHPTVPRRYPAERPFRHPP
jgi:hypothetical protein